LSANAAHSPYPVSCAFGWPKDPVFSAPQGEIGQR
jgi:hypothetical protein